MTKLISAHVGSCQNSFEINIYISGFLNLTFFANKFFVHFLKDAVTLFKCKLNCEKYSSMFDVM